MISTSRTSLIIYTLLVTQIGFINGYTTTSKTKSFTTKRVQTPEDIMNVASFRNDCKSPELMIQLQKEKNESFNKLESTKDGVVTGLGIGLLAGCVTGVIQQDVEVGVQTFGTLGPIIAILLGINNFAGKRVYIMTLPEAQNRLIVDYVASLKSGDDVGFVAVLNDKKHPIYQYTGGVMGCVDCTANVLPSKGVLPSHIYIKNMEVRDGMRRCGVAKKLLDDVERYAKSAGAEMVTLEVEDSNTAAINLYENAGYQKESIGSPMARSKYGSWVIGRSIMMKKL